MLLRRSIDTASASAYALARNLTAVRQATASDIGIQKFTQLNTTLQNAAAATAAGTTAMSRFGDAAQATGFAGSRAIASLSAETATAVAGIATLTRFMHNATRQMERMDILRASYQRIMAARPDMTGTESLNRTMSAFWDNSKTLAYQYGAAIDDVAGTMIEFARQGHSPQVVQYLTKELAELRLMLATSTGKLVDMRSAMGSVITLMNQMGASATEAVSGLKLISEYDIRTATSFSSVSEAINRFAAAGRVANMSMKDMIQAATAFTEIGIQGARAGTALNTIIARVANTKKAKDMLTDLGVSLTVIENGAVRATSTFEQLVEAFKKVKATGNKDLLQLFGYNMAGARMQSVMFAGLEQYIKQTTPQVNKAQFENMTRQFGNQLTSTLSSVPITINPKATVLGANITLDEKGIREKLLAGVAPLMESFRKEFEQRGTISLPDDISLMHGPGYAPASYGYDFAVWRYF